MQVLEKVARAMSSKYNVNVVFRGSKAYTDGRTIVLPALPEALEESDMRVARGYGDHEVGHVKHTDFEALRAQVGEDKKLHTVWNYLEDLMIERKQSEEFPGARDNMNFLVNWLVENGELDLSHPLMKLFIEGRRALCGYDIPALPSYRKELESIFGANLFEKLARASSTQDNIDHARKLIGSYEREEEQNGQSERKEEQQSEEDSENYDEEQSNDGQNEASDEKENEEEQSDDGQGEASDEEEQSGSGSGDDEESKEEQSEESDDGQNDDGNGSGEESKSSDINGEPEGYDEEAGDEEHGEESKSALCEGRKSSKRPELEDAEDPYSKIRDYIEGKHVEALQSSKEYMVYSREKDVLEPMEEAKTLGSYNKLKAELGSLNALRGKVQSLFLARTQSRWQNDREEGRINPRALAKLITGSSNRIFREKFTSKDRDTAVSFLVDYSGSMKGHPLECAMKAAVCFLEALDGSKVKSECLTFTTGDLTYESSSIYYSDPNYDQYGRVEALDMKIIKSFDEPYGAKVKRRISGYRKCENRNNCDGDSVQIAAQRLLARKEQRKILFVLTDGLVGNYGNTDRGMSFLKKVCQDCTRAGIELIGVGLNVRDLARYYPRTIDIQAASDLPAHLFKELRRILKV